MIQFNCVHFYNVVMTKIAINESVIITNHFDKMKNVEFIVLQSLINLFRLKWTFFCFKKKKEKDNAIFFCSFNVSIRSCLKHDTNKHKYKHYIHYINIYYVMLLC